MNTAMDIAPPQSATALEALDVKVSVVHHASPGESELAWNGKKSETCYIIRLRDIMYHVCANRVQYA